MGRTPDMAGGICADRDQTEVEWAPELANLLESRADGKIILGIVVIFAFGKFRDRSIPGIAIRSVSKHYKQADYVFQERNLPREVEIAAARLNRPRTP